MLDASGTVLELEGEPDDLAIIVETLLRCHPQGWPDARPPRLADLDVEAEDLEPWREMGLLFIG